MPAKPYLIERRRIIDAPNQTIYEFLEDFRRWEGWSPWEKIDPQMTRDYSGTAHGVGAHYEWHGNRKAGAGSMHITAAAPYSEVEIDLVFDKPLKATNTLKFLLQPHGAETEVVWQMRGVNSGLGGAFFKLSHAERSIGQDFERGLEQLAVAATHQSHGHQ